MTRYKFIRAQLSAPSPSVVWALPMAALAVIAPTFIRQMLDPFVSDVTFTTYYPFVLLSALFLGGRYGVAVALGSAVVANFLFMSPRRTMFADLSDTLGAAMFLASALLVVAVARTLRRGVRELEESRKREADLNRELQHRVKNTLTVVQGLATQTFRGVGPNESALRTFNGRLYALAQANDVLGGAKWEVCELPELACRALSPFNEQGAIHMNGLTCSLPEVSCVPLVLALHELGTNAVKYGALSTLDGSVKLEWSLRKDNGGGDHLVMTWIETGGPIVSPPTRRGLGSRLLTPQQGLANVSLDFRPEGLTCEMVIAGARTLSAS